jgi:branched-subunit amino acid aminotransferase/4-amino-4-deoxychorismate lyase
LVTPREEVLWGIVQGLVMELAQAARAFRLSGGASRLKNLLAADEVLLTGSSKGIVPVVDIDGQIIGTGRPGAFSGRLAAAYQEQEAAT